MAQEFAGAWPYLELIAHGTGLDDPLDRRVVEAYWVGSPRLDRIGVRAIGNSDGPVPVAVRAAVRQPRRGRAGRGRPPPQLCRLLHLPWVGLLGDDRRAAGAHRARPVPDSLGRVLAVAGDQVSVEYRPLTWDGRQLGYGPPEVEIAVRRRSRAYFGAGRRGLGCAALGVDLRQDHRDAGPVPEGIHRSSHGHRQHRTSARWPRLRLIYAQPIRQVRSSDQVTSAPPPAAAVPPGGPDQTLIGGELVVRCGPANRTASPSGTVTTEPSPRAGPASGPPRTSSTDVGPVSCRPQVDRSGRTPPAANRPAPGARH